MSEQDETYLKKAFEATKRTFKKAWEYDKKFETPVQYRIEKATSVVAPFLVLLATAEMNYQYWRRSDKHILLIVIVSLMGLAFSTGILLFACSSLEAHLTDRSSQNEESESDGPLRGSPMLAFAAFLFSLGAAFTAVEAIEHFYVPAIGYPDGNGNRADFKSPWGDILLAASAICMLVEEFILLTMYDSVKKEAYRVRVLIDDDEFRNLVEEAKESATKIENASAEAERHGGDIERYSDRAKVLATEAKKSQSEAKAKFEGLRAAMVTVMVIVVVVVLAMVALAGFAGLYVSQQLGRYDRSLEEMERGAADEPAERDEPEEQVDAPPVSEEPEAQPDAPVASEEPEAQPDAAVASEEPGEPPDAPIASEEPGEPPDAPVTNEDPEEQRDAPGASEEPEDGTDGAVGSNDESPEQAAVPEGREGA